MNSTPSLLDKVQEIYRDIPRINQEVLPFLRDWLSKHILVEDMKYAVLSYADN